MSKLSRNHKNIVILTSAHEPYDVRIYHKEIQSLLSKYSNITLVAPYVEDKLENFGQDIRLKTFPGRNAKLFSYVKPLKNIYHIMKSMRPDVIHCHEPDSLLLGYFLIWRHFKRCKLIYDCHEYYPESFGERFPHYLKKIIKWSVLYFEKHLSKKSHLIITVNDILVDKFKKYHDNVIKLPNYPRKESLSLSKSQDRNFEFIYVGIISRARGIFKMIQASELLANKGYSFKILCIGRFQPVSLKQEIESMLKEKKLERYFLFTDEIKPLEVPKYFSDARVGLLLLQPNIHRYTISEPIKLFEYLGNGLPVIASDYPMLGSIVQKYECGVLVDPTDENEIMASMEQSLLYPDQFQEKGRKGRQAVLKYFNWNLYEKLLLRKYEELLN